MHRREYLELVQKGRVHTREYLRGNGTLHIGEMFRREDDKEIFRRGGGVKRGRSGRGE